jgi:hypothetical protein
MEVTFAIFQIFLLEISKVPTLAGGVEGIFERYSTGDSKHSNSYLQCPSNKGDELRDYGLGYLKTADLQAL